MAIGTGAALFLLWIGILSSPALSDFVISKLDRVIDLRSQIVRTTSKLKIILPEGSKDVDISLPFSTKQWHEVPEEFLFLSAAFLNAFFFNYRFLHLVMKREMQVKYAHLDIVGQPVVAIQKTNVIPELNEYFQVQAAIQQVQNIVNQCLAVHDKLETSLRDLSRTGDVQSCKAVRKTVDGLLKDLNTNLKPLLVFLKSAPQADKIWSKVDELATKEKEMLEKLILKHSMVVDSFEKKHGAREMDNRVAPVQQKLSILRQEVDELLDVIDEF